MTNYEKIKNMSVKEMAKMLLFKKFSCMPFCEECDNCNQYNYTLPHCKEGIKLWLNSDARMDEEIKEIDLNVLKTSCDELKIELVPAKEKECVILTDKTGNKCKIPKGWNIFDVVEVGNLYSKNAERGNEQ